MPNLPRKGAVIDFSDRLNKVEIIYPEYLPQDYFRVVNPVRENRETTDFSNGVNLKEESPGRCSLCWALRLKRTAQVAKEKGFDSFSSTLLVSPYQNQELLKEIGNTVAKEEGIDFYYEDFRPGFRQAHNEAKARGVYCQKYCGCVYSEMERCRKSVKP